MSQVALEIVRIVAVIALVCVAAAVLTPKGRMPLALRGICKILRKDRTLAGAEQDKIPEPVSLRRRLLGLFLLFLAFGLAIIKL